MEGNAIEAITATPRKQAAPETDWLSKPEYGKTPEYLKQIKADVAAETVLLKSLVDRKGAPPVVGREMPEAERAELLAALRTRYAEVRGQGERRRRAL